MAEQTVTFPVSIGQRVERVDGAQLAAELDYVTGLKVTSAGQIATIAGGARYIVERLRPYQEPEPPEPPKPPEPPETAVNIVAELGARSQREGDFDSSTFAILDTLERLAALIDGKVDA
jgi:hypothetical protein